MSVQTVINNFNLDLFRAKTHFYLRHNSISSDNWEKAIAESTGGKWVRGSADLADAYHAQEKVIFSVKSRKIDPAIKKRIDNRDFMSNPEFYHFGGTKFSEGDLDNIHTVSGRCSIPGLDEQSSPAKDIGTAAISRYNDFELASLQKFKCNETLDVVIIHGESKSRKDYLLRVMFFNHTLNPINIWHDQKFDGPRTRYKGHRAAVMGFDQHGPHIGRIANLGRQQTCMLRFYRKSEALHIIDTSIPMPLPETFSFADEWKMINK